MDNIEELNDKLIRVYSSLSPAEKKIAKFLKKHSDNIVFFNIVSLSKKLRLSPASISKFAKTLGLNGFKDLQRIYRKKLSTSLVEGGFSEKYKIAYTNYKNGNIKDIADNIIKHDIHSLKMLSNKINLQHLKEAVNIIENANAVYIIGQLRSESIANWLCYTLTMIGKKNYLLNFASNDMYLNRANYIGKDDVLIAISFQFYSNLVVELTTKVKHNNCKVISITDGDFSPLYQVSDICFSIPQEEYLFSKSLSSAMSLSLIITTILAQKMDTKND